jgi:hypothetical protein
MSRGVTKKRPKTYYILFEWPLTSSPRVTYGDTFVVDWFLITIKELWPACIVYEQPQQILTAHDMCNSVYKNTSANYDMTCYFLTWNGWEDITL